VTSLKGLSPVEKLKLGQVTIGYRSIGKGPVILLLPGGRMNMHHWDPEFVEYLSRDYQVYLFDYPGIGYSTYQNMPYTVETLANCVKRFLMVLNIRPKAVLGYSLGGWVAQELAIQQENRVNSLILINTDAGGDQEIRRDETTQKELEKDFQTESKERSQASVSWLFPKEVVPRVKDKMKSIYNIAVIEGDFDQDFLKKQKSLVEDWHKKTDNAKEIQKLSLPVLLVVGDKDRMISPENTNRLSKLFKHAKVIHYKDAGHGVFYQYPRDLSEQIKLFLNAHSASRYERG